MFYNLLKGENTVLKGLLAEEFASYTLSQRLPILIVRPSTALKYLANASIIGKYVDFIRRNQQTMDFLGIAPYYKDNNFRFKPEEIIYRFFYEKEGLTRFLTNETSSNQLSGFIIEVKSRTGINAWAPFQFSFSPNQVEMIDQSQIYDLKIILCGVTFASDWNLSVVFCDENQKVLSEEFFKANQ
ncbi:MAG: hypothetical protein ACW991_07580 [Candidatus Hodarchaeales archaeon]|jgi:hypothetical protein